MHWKNGSLIGAILFSLCVSAGTYAQEGAPSSDTDELKVEIKALRQEIAALRKEFAGLRSELSKAVVAMRTGKQQPAPRRQPPAMTMVGQKAPEFSLKGIDGQEVMIGGKRGKLQVLYYYASWCPHCKKSMPWIESVYQKYKDKGVEVIAVNLDARGEGGRARTEEQTLEQYKSLNVSMPMTMTTSDNNTAAVGAAYKAQSFPTFFVLGPSGEVESAHVGAKPDLESIIGKELDLLLQGKTRADFPKEN